MLPLPRRYAHFLYAILQAALTTAVATGIATWQSSVLGLAFLERWAWTWLIAWLAMLPVVIFVAPLIQRAVVALTAPKPVRRGRERPEPGSNA
jgi:hypothetical protein